MNINPYIQRYYRNIARFQGPANKPNQSQFYCLTAENAEYAEVINVHIGRDRRITGTNLLGGLRDLCGE